MTRKPARPTWRAIVVDPDTGDGYTLIVYAPDSDDAAQQAEEITGMDCVVVDDITPSKRPSRRPGLLTVTA